MSRGLGRLQREILEAVRGGAPVQVCRVCWDFARAANAFSGQGSQRELARPFYSSFLQSLHRLKRERLLEVDKRKITTSEELINYYPWQTRTEWLVELRRELLPVVATQIARTAPAYSPRDNEAYLLQRLSPQGLERARVAWAEVEALAREEFRSGTNRHETIMALLARGRELFVTGSRFSCALGLGEAVDEIRGAEVPPSALAIAAERVLATVFPQRTLSRTQFKSQLYAYASLRAHETSPGISPELKGVLAATRRDLIEVIPPVRSRSGIRPGAPAQYVLRSGHDLDRLIQRDVLRDILFVRASA